jgi:TrmH family RNA methyltransferase
MAAPALLPRLTSRQHALVRACRDLAHGGRSEGRVLLDGPHLVVDALAAGAAIECILATRAALDAEPGLTAALDAGRDLAVYEASPGVLDAASPARTPSGVVAIAKWTPAALADLFASSPALVLALDGVQDPGNVGGIIRSADALGASGVVAAGHSADPGNWKSLRGSAGSIFRIPVARGDLGHAIQEARRRHVTVVAAVPRDGRDPSSIPFDGPTLLLLGAEGAGLDASVAASADDRVTVPLRAGVESLNVGIAAALLLDTARRRRTGREPSAVSR